MTQTEAFLTATEESEIVEAIRIAELNTSGEIRVHIEEFSETPPMARAIEVFDQLKMYKTRARNGVLFYVNVRQKSFAVIGDKGINKKVSADFWDSTKELVLENFKQNLYKKGLIEGITEAGKQLKSYFPYHKNDTNELSNEISKG